MDNEIPFYIPDVVEPPRKRGFADSLPRVQDNGWQWVKPVVAVVAGVVVLSTVTDLVRAIKE